MKDTVIVSGYPRSGTSMMMRMLTLGGMEPLTTHDPNTARGPAIPYGSYELDNVAQDIEDHPPEWTAGKLFKLITIYINWLPLDRPVKVVFMIRDVPEIVSSLIVQGAVWDETPVDSIGMAREFLQDHNIPTHFVNYRDVIQYPRATAVGVKEFLELPLNPNEMIKAVDSNARHAFTKSTKNKELVLWPDENKKKELVDNTIVLWHGPDDPP